MIQRLLCWLGFHYWHDSLQHTSEKGYFKVKKCFNCNTFRVYKMYTLDGYERRRLLKNKEIPNNVLKDIKKLK